MNLGKPCSGATFPSLFKLQGMCKGTHELDLQLASDHPNLLVLQPMWLALSPMARTEFISHPYAFQLFAYLLGPDGRNGYGCCGAKTQTGLILTN